MDKLLEDAAAFMSSKTKVLSEGKLKPVRETFLKDAITGLRDAINSESDFWMELLEAVGEDEAMEIADQLERNIIGEIKKIAKRDLK